ncbi:uncharacterized protein LOC119735274 [Patiria miniata]|uniref:Uncharacterized protein n=1 Tax=Patiria miniata TaxID=46514 RepID=A0A914AMD6_PATMI|nr:uncharacterized protein LOC119735274 [Patiria miniata]
MREWWTSAFHPEELSLAWGRRRGERPTNPASNLVALPILLLFLGIPSQYREGYLWLCAAGTVSEYLQENSTGGGGELERYGPPANPVGQRLPLPSLTNKHVSYKVPLRQDSDYNNNMHEMFRRTTVGKGADDRTERFSWRKTRRKSRRHRRGVVDPDAPDVPPTDWTVQPTPTEQGEFPPSSVSTFTPVPDYASTASAQSGSDMGTSYARTSSYLQSTPSVQEVELEATTNRRPGGFSRPITPPSPSLSDTGSQRTTIASLTFQFPPTFIPPHGSTLPNPTSPSAPDDPNARPTTPPETTGGTAFSDRRDSNSPEPSTLSQSSTVTDGISSFTEAETDTVTPGDLAAETRQTSPASRSPSTGVILNSSAESTSRASTGLTGPSKLNVEGKSAKQSSVYTIISEIHTEPSILIIMPCLVGLALLGLAGAGIKRYILHWRLAHMVELTRDPEKLKEDKGYTIENPMVKSRRSYIERQVEKTLQRVNKTDSSNSSSSSTHSSSRNTNNNKDTKVRMEIATISDGSLRRPDRPLRRSASERIAPSHRRWSSAGYARSASQASCHCCCHCSQCGRIGRPLRNGSVPVEATTRV